MLRSNDENHPRIVIQPCLIGKLARPATPPSQVRQAPFSTDYRHAAVQVCHVCVAEIVSAQIKNIATQRRGLRGQQLSLLQRTGVYVRFTVWFHHERTGNIRLSPAACRARGTRQWTTAAPLQTRPNDNDAITGHPHGLYTSCSRWRPIMSRSHRNRRHTKRYFRRRKR